MNYRHLTPESSHFKVTRKTVSFNRFMLQSPGGNSHIGPMSILLYDSFHSFPPYLVSSEKIGLEPRRMSRLQGSIVSSTERRGLPYVASVSVQFLHFTQFYYYRAKRRKDRENV